MLFIGLELWLVQMASVGVLVNLETPVFELFKAVSSNYNGYEERRIFVRN